MFATGRILKIILAIAFGLVVVAAAVEIGLRLLHVFIGVTIHKPVETAGGATRFLIVCAGDSHTAGVHVGPGQDYPSQLDALLDRAFPQAGIDVLNVGRPGANSSEAVLQVTDFLVTNKRAPDLVLFEAGKNNNHNFRFASIFEDPAFQTDDRQIWARHLLASSRAFRLSQITLDRLTHLGESPQDMPPNTPLIGETDRDREMLQQWVRLDVDRLNRRVREAGGTLALVNYWQPIAWVDAAFESAAADGFSFIDIRRFGLPLPASMISRNKLVLKDYHPSAEGYARIAEMVAEGLGRARLLPGTE